MRWPHLSQVTTLKGDHQEFYPPSIRLVFCATFFCPRRCASCSTCNRVLDVSSAVAGQDNGLYCQVQDFESNSCSWCDKHFRVMSDYVKIQQSQLVRVVTVGNMERPAFEEQVLQLGRLRTLAGPQLQMLRCQVGCNRYSASEIKCVSLATKHDLHLQETLARKMVALDVAVASMQRRGCQLQAQLSIGFTTPLYRCRYVIICHDMSY